MTSASTLMRSTALCSTESAKHTRRGGTYSSTIAYRPTGTFSFVGETVLDPISRTGTTSVGAALLGRNIIGFEIDETCLAHATSRFSKENSGLINQASLVVNAVSFMGKALAFAKSRGSYVVNQTIVSIGGSAEIARPTRRRSNW